MNLNTTLPKPSQESSTKSTNSKTQRDQKLLKDAIQQCHNRLEYDRSLSETDRDRLRLDMIEQEAQLAALLSDV